MTIHENSTLLNCSVREFSAAETPPYVCLSYVWADYGPQPQRGRDFKLQGEVEAPSFSYKDQKSIILNDKSIKIGANLHAALTGLCSDLKGRPIWTDAICINQSDWDEKTIQVQKMGATYGNAEEVFIWLGRRHGTRDAGFALLKSWPDYPRDVNNAKIQFHGKIYTTARDFFNATAGSAELNSWLFLMLMVSESWWSRYVTLARPVFHRKKRH